MHASVLSQLPASHHAAMIVDYSALPEGHELSEETAHAVYIYARLYQVQEIEAGVSVGYCQDYIASSKRRIATVTIGYTDGYPWRLANKGCVVIDGHKAPIVGRISMDLLTVDVTGVPDHLLKGGQWVQVVGPENTLTQMAGDADLPVLSVLTGLGQRFKRIYLGKKE